MSRVLNRFSLGVAFATGYVLGAQAGRRRYEQIMVLWSGFLASPIVQRATERGKEVLGQAGQTLSEQARARIGNSRHANLEVSEPSLTVRAFPR
jgi:hypothetical protein